MIFLLRMRWSMGKTLFFFGRRVNREEKAFLGRLKDAMMREKFARKSPHSLEGIRSEQSTPSSH